MKKKIFGAVLIAAMAVTAGWNFNQSKNEMGLSDLALAPNQQKFAVAEIYGGVLEIFQIADSIKLNSIYPFFEYKKNELHGFVDLCATDSYIYAIKIDSNNMDGTDKNNKYNKIMVFDWEGKYIKTFQTDYNLLTLDVDESSNYIYAIGQNISLDSEIQVISFKM